MLSLSVSLYIYLYIINIYILIFFFQKAQQAQDFQFQVASESKSEAARSLHLGSFLRNHRPHGVAGVGGPNVGAEDVQVEKYRGVSGI